jgi:hypothetical protein
MDTSLPGHHAPKPVSKKTVEQRKYRLHVSRNDPSPQRGISRAWNVY